MADKKTKTTKEEVKTVSEPSVKTIGELKLELQKMKLDVKTGKEANTSLLKKLRKEIARKLTAAK